MSLHAEVFALTPEDTVLVARAAFPKGNRYMRMRDELGTIYDDKMFGTLFPACGQPAESPWRLALVLIMQFAENLSDRQAADAVRARIDWKYALSLDLTDPGFDFSVLSEFRDRLLNGSIEQHLLDAMLTAFTEQGILKARGKQRTDSTHVLAAIRTLNRLESVSETLRAALNQIASVAPDWLLNQITVDWFDRYSLRAEEYRLPKGQDTRKELSETVGRDGVHLLTAIYSPTAPKEVRALSSVEILRQAWIHQYYFIDGQLRQRSAADLAPSSLRFDSPYDPDAHFGNKRTTTWTGYKVHVTETCDADTPHFITHVETTIAPVTDNVMTAPIHQALADKALLPSTHVVDAGYVDVELLLQSTTTHQISLLGPVRPNSSWQAQEGQGYDISHFRINWEQQTITCPQGQTASQWSPAQDNWGNQVIHVKFPRKACRLCSQRGNCTRAKNDPREITLRPQEEHETLQHARQQQTTPEWKTHYQVRAGVEGTLSQGVRAFGLRKTRYLGRAKTHLQHIITAAAINIVRFDAWKSERPRAKTRISHFQALRPLLTAATA